MTEFVPDRLERRDASGQIARQLRAAIGRGVWQPGERLPTELDLATTFDVSRATAREGLKLLSATGLVVSTRGGNGGTFVAVPNAGDVAHQLSDAIRLWYRAGDVTVGDVDEARRVLELHTVELAAQRRTDADIDAIRRPVDAAREPDLSMERWLELDLEFHTAITRAAKNPILELAMTAVHLARPATNTVFVDQLDRVHVTDQHERIQRAIAAGDPAAARAAFGDHAAYLGEVRRSALAQQDASAVLVASLPGMPADETAAPH